MHQLSSFSSLATERGFCSAPGPSSQPNCLPLVQVRAADKPQKFNFMRDFVAALSIAAVHIAGSVIMVALVSPDHWWGIHPLPAFKIRSLHCLISMTAPNHHNYLAMAVHLLLQGLCLPWLGAATSHTWQRHHQWAGAECYPAAATLQRQSGSKSTACACHTSCLPVRETGCAQGIPPALISMSGNAPTPLSGLSTRPWLAL